MRKFSSFVYNAKVELTYHQKPGASKEHTPAPIPLRTQILVNVQDTRTKKLSRDDYETSELQQPAIDVAEFASESANLSPAKRQKLVRVEQATRRIYLIKDLSLRSALFGSVREHAECEQEEQTYPRSV
jgi:hypothetical protein